MKKMSTGEAIKEMNKRIDWLESKSDERSKKGEASSYFQSEIEACELAIKALEEMRERNIAKNNTRSTEEQSATNNTASLSVEVSNG